MSKVFRPGKSEPEESLRVDASKASALADLGAARVIAALFADADGSGEVPRIAGWTSESDEALIAFRDGMTARTEMRLADAILLLVEPERIQGITPPPVISMVRAGKGTVTDELLNAGFELLDDVHLMESQYVLKFRLRRQ